MEESNLVVKN